MQNVGNFLYIYLLIFNKTQDNAATDLLYLLPPSVHLCGADHHPGTAEVAAHNHDQDEDQQHDSLHSAVISSLLLRGATAAGAAEPNQHEEAKQSR